MIVATPELADGAETTTAYEVTCDAGPLGLIGVTTGL
jgi:hypothetical protein